MPELPEVETIRLQLEKELIGDIFVSIQVLDRTVFEGQEQKISGQKIVSVGRVGKYIFIHFESGMGMTVHLKMTGRLLLNQAPPEHTRIVAQLASGRTLYYWDTRKFGYWKVNEDSQQVEQMHKTLLGPEPWHIDEVSLLRKLQKTSRTIKDVLLDQTILAGVGNIYANDGLWLAGIKPTRRANTIGLMETKKLLESLRQVMERGKELGGASDNTYRDLYGNKGRYQTEFLVYSKTGGECLTCGRELTYIKVGGRGTWYCNQCQR